MDDYWKKFWEEHARLSPLLHPQQQVLRTVDKEPISTEQFQAILDDIDGKLDLLEGDVVLDLCCGNGVITRYFAPKCKRMIGVDFAPGLVKFVRRKRQNIDTIVADVRDVKFNDDSFDRVLIYAGLQYLSPGETIHLFESTVRWLREGGLFLVGDIPDRAKLWQFFDTTDGMRAHFEATKKDKPLIGTWFESEWLARLGEWVGFNKMEIFQQPDNLPFSHYRFDMIFGR